MASLFKSKAFQVFLIVFASEAIYTLPFHVPRFFRYEFLNCFGFCNEELSEAQSLYGIVALLCYFPGGMIAETLSPLIFIMASLFLSSLAGVVLFFHHDFFTLKMVYAFWGASTGLLFWSSLVAFVRCESDANAQGKAFGSLEFGRGVLAASLVTFLNLMLSQSNPLMHSYGGVSESKIRLYVIFAFYILVNFLAAILCFILLKNKKSQLEGGEKSSSFDLERLKAVCLNPAVWCNLVIVICAYCSFKALDFYALMLKESFHFSKEYLLHFITVLAWARPLSAFLVGLLGDKLTPSRACSLCFVLIFTPTLGIYFYPPSVLGLPVFFSLIILQLVGVFGLRGVYFALFGEANVNKEDTALATGFISFLGFTPEFFLPLLAVNLIDKNGLAGAQSFFLFILGLSCIGFLATSIFKKFCGHKVFS